MENLLLSVLANILSTLIEYGIVKPRFEIDDARLPQSGKRDWSTAVSIAIRKLRSTQGGHLLPFGEHYRVEDIHIQKGKGILTLVVLPKSAVVFAYAWLSFLINAFNVDTFPNVIARYRIIIDRSGDILDVKSLFVAENERYRPLYIPHSRSQFTALPKNELVLKEIKKPIKKITAEGLLIQIEFIVENWGNRERTIYPFVRYKVAELVNGSFKERVVHSPENWKINLKARSSTPISFSALYAPATQLVAKGKDKVYVRLYTKPWKIKS